MSTGKQVKPGPQESIPWRALSRSHVRLTLDPEDAELPVRWRVRYERVESFVGTEEAGAVVVGGAVLGEGVLAPVGVAVADPGAGEQGTSGDG